MGNFQSILEFFNIFIAGYLIIIVVQNNPSVLCCIKQLLLLAFWYNKDKRIGSTNTRDYTGEKEQDVDFSEGSWNCLAFKKRLAMYAECEYCAFIHFAKCVMLCKRWDNFCLRGVIWKMKDCVQHVPTAWMVGRIIPNTGLSTQL